MTSEIVFNVLDWYSEDTVPEEDGDVSHYVIKMFGKTQDGQSVSVTVKGYLPHFYLKLPRAFNPPLMKNLDALIRRRCGHNLDCVVAMQRKDYWGFRNDETSHFAQVRFFNHLSMKKSTAIFKAPLRIEGTGANYAYPVYESNIDPFIRFIHSRNISPSGWVRVKNFKKVRSPSFATTCDIDVETTYNEVFGMDNNERIAPFKIASFDIECTSFDGEFPVPIRDFAKIARSFVDSVGGPKWRAGKKKDADEDGSSEEEDEDEAEAEDPVDFSVKGLGRRLPEYISARIREGKLVPKVKLDDDQLAAKIAEIATWSYQIEKMFEGSVGWESGRDKVLDASARRKPFSDECMSSVGSFLQSKLPEMEGDPIIMVGTVINKYGDLSTLTKYIHVVGTCAPIAGASVRCFDSEKDMLLAWTKDVVNEIDPDILIGYNIFGFDWEYMYGRSKELRCADEFMKLTRFKFRPAKFERKSLSSSALGDNIMKFVDVYGRPSIDIMKVVQRDHKLDSFKLDNVAKHFLGDKKNDVSPNDIFRLYKGSAEDRRVVAEYCIQDCALLNRLFAKLEILANNIGMSCVCFVPLSWIFMRGQSVKIFSLVAKRCKADGFLIPVIRGKDHEQPDGHGYEGALVLTPEPAMHMDYGIVVFDFASLYPSSMIAENVSHNTILLDADRYDNLEGVSYHNIEFRATDGSWKTCRFVDAGPNGEREGVLPRILRDLLQARKRTRKRIAMRVVRLDDGREIRGYVSGLSIQPEDGSSEPIVVSSASAIVSNVPAYDEFQQKVLEGLQLAYKVTANSLYGQTGAETSALFMKDLAASTTATGRNMIMDAKNFMESNYGVEVIYGDSVAEYTPLVVRNASHNQGVADQHGFTNSAGLVEVMRVDEIAERFGKGKWRHSIATMDDKEYCEVQGVDVWTDGGWTRVQRIMRHDLDPKKSMVRVFTDQAVVDVTSDHSLLRPNLSPVKPSELVDGDELLHARLPVNTIVSKSVAEFFDAEHMTSEELKVSVDFTSPISPEILNGTRALKQRYFDARMSTFPDSTRFTHPDPVVACSMAVLATSIGKHFGTGWNVEEGYVIKMLPSAPSKKVRALANVQYSGKVYDLTTENHRFHAGVGNMIVHNTDSLFIKAPFAPPANVDEMTREERDRELLRQAFEFGDAAAAAYNKQLKKPHSLEFEKVMFPFYIFSPKKYAGNLFDPHNYKPKFKFMGIVLKRRDNAPIVKTIYGESLDILINKHDINLAVSHLAGLLQRLVDGEFPIDQLVITKSLRSNYKDPMRIAHKVLADRIAERDPGNKPQVNDRIPFVYFKVPGKTDKEIKLQGERIETPSYMSEKGLKPDYHYYISHQIMKPLQQLFGLVVDKLPGYNKPPDYWQRVKAKLIAGSDKKSEKPLSEEAAREKIVKMREDEVNLLLFEPILVNLGSKAKKRKDMLAEPKVAVATAKTTTKATTKTAAGGVKKPRASTKKPKEKEKTAAGEASTSAAAEEAPEPPAKPKKPRVSKKPAAAKPAAAKPAAAKTMAPQSKESAAQQ